MANLSTWFALTLQGEELTDEESKALAASIDAPDSLLAKLKKKLITVENAANHGKVRDLIRQQERKDTNAIFAKRYNKLGKRFTEWTEEEISSLIDEAGSPLNFIEDFVEKAVETAKKQAQANGSKTEEDLKAAIKAEFEKKYSGMEATNNELTSKLQTAEAAKKELTEQFQQKLTDQSVNFGLQTIFSDYTLNPAFKQNPMVAKSIRDGVFSAVRQKASLLFNDSGELVAMRKDDPTAVLLGEDNQPLNLKQIMDMEVAPYIDAKKDVRPPAPGTTTVKPKTVEAQKSEFVFKG